MMFDSLPGHTLHVETVQTDVAAQPQAQGLARLLGLPLAPGLIALQGMNIDCYTQFVQQKTSHIEAIMGQQNATHRWLVMASRTTESLILLSYLCFEAQKLTYVRQHLLSAFTRLPWYFTYKQAQDIYQLHAKLFGQPLDVSARRAVFSSPRYETNQEVLVLRFAASAKVKGMYHLLLEQGYERDVQAER